MSMGIRINARFNSFIGVSEKFNDNFSVLYNITIDCVHNVTHFIVVLLLYPAMSGAWQELFPQLFYTTVMTNDVSYDKLCALL